MIHRLLIPCLVFALCGCSDQISRSYSTLREAQEDIGKGWIPPILPPSTHSIRDSHDLDLNIGEGSFLFDPKEIDYPISQGGKIEKISPENKSDFKLQKEGCRFVSYSKNNSEWLIALHPDGKGWYGVK